VTKTALDIKRMLFHGKEKQTIKIVPLPYNLKHIAKIVKKYFNKFPFIIICKKNLKGIVIVTSIN